VLESENCYCDIALKSRSIDMLDQEPQVALKKIKGREEILKILPGLDCGACGAPTCKSFAEDVLLGHASLGECMLRKDRTP